MHLDISILPNRPYPPCLRMADRALLTGYPRYYMSNTAWRCEFWRRLHLSQAPSTFVSWDLKVTDVMQIADGDHRGRQPQGFKGAVSLSLDHSRCQWPLFLTAHNPSFSLLLCYWQSRILSQLIPNETSTGPEQNGWYFADDVFS